MRGFFWMGVSTVGNLCFQIDWACLLVGSKFSVFALCCFVFEGNFPSTIKATGGGLYSSLNSSDL